MMQHIADGADHIYLALGATDFRKQQNGLTSLIALKFIASSAQGFRNTPGVRLSENLVTMYICA